MKFIEIGQSVWKLCSFKNVEYFQKWAIGPDLLGLWPHASKKSIESFKMPYFHPKPRTFLRIWELDEEIWSKFPRVMAKNVFGHFVCSRKFVRKMEDLYGRYPHNASNRLETSRFLLKKLNWEKLNDNVGSHTNRVLAYIRRKNELLFRKRWSYSVNSTFRNI